MVFLEVKEDIPGPVQTIIKAIGAGGAGQNAINCMIERGLENVQFIAVNTDSQALARSRAGTKLTIGMKSTMGRGAGGKPEVGEAAAEEDREAITNAIRGAEMIFVTAGMGGGTGTGSAHVIARIAHELGILTVAIVTKPFDFEGKKKMALAEEGIRKLRSAVDTLIVIPNSRLLALADRKLGIQDTFHLADDVLRQAIQGISDMITKTGEINIDFADVTTIMKDQGDALMGIGIGTGETRAHDAVAQAMNNPLLEETSIVGAKNLLMGVCGGPGKSLVEYQEVFNYASDKVSEDANIIGGYSIDPNMGDKIQVTVIATGYETARDRARRLAEEEEEKKMRPGKELFNFSDSMASNRSFRSDDLDVPTVIRNSKFHIVKPEPVEDDAGRRSAKA
jgi:cell division protein FtsZ